MTRTAIAFAALLVLGACSESKVETVKPDKASSVRIDVDRDGGKAAGGTSITIDGDSETGKFAISLPGGIEAKVNLPEGLGEGGKFDIDGVGLYPGAKVDQVNVNASNARETKSAIVKIGFTAPGDAAAVADWYQAQFEARRMKVSRSGETLSGTNAEGDAFTIALQTIAKGRSRGLTTLIDSDKS